MMGKETKKSTKLFYHFNLAERIPSNHPLRQLKSILNLDFVYSELDDLYGDRGNVSIPPPVLIKMMILLTLYNVPSEREFMRTLPMRLDWLWFLGYDIDDELPNHSVLSKARKRWGEDVFRKLFESVLLLALESNLVDGKKMFVDASLVDANASKNSLEWATDMTILRATSDELVNRLDGEESEFDEQPLRLPVSCSEEEKLDLSSELNSSLESAPNTQPVDLENEEAQSPLSPDEICRDFKIVAGSGQESLRIKKAVNEHYRSQTDEDSTLAIDKHRGGTQLRYKVHRSVDSAYEIITSCHTSTGKENDADFLMDMVLDHSRSVGLKPQIVVGDSKYGTKENLVNVKRMGIKPHIRDLSQSQNELVKSQGKFCKSDFHYNKAADHFVCPGDEVLENRSYNSKRKTYNYQAPKNACDECSLRGNCTDSKSSGRTIGRYIDEEELEQAYCDSRSAESKKDLKQRQHLMERSFAIGIQYGYKRARWRGLWRVSIQQLLAATVQNLLKIMKYGQTPLALNQAALSFLASADIKMIYFRLFGLDLWESVCTAARKVKYLPLATKRLATSH